MRILPVLAALLLAPLSAAAHVGDQVYPLYEFADSELPDLRDGSLDDWTALFAGPTLTEHDFSSLLVGDGAPIGLSDLGVNIYLGWNANQNRLYAAFERLDDVYINEYEGGDLTSLWRHDSVELMVDGDHSGDSYHGFGLGTDWVQEDRRLLTNFQAQHFVAIPQAPDDHLLGYLGYGTGWVPFPPYGDAGGFVDETGPLHRSVVEMMVTAFDSLYWDDPERSRESLLETGRIIGLQVSIPDFDEAAGEYHGFSTLHGAPNTWREADNFVDFLLLGTDDRPPVSESELPPYTLDPDDFFLQDHDRDGRVEAGEEVFLRFLPPAPYRRSIFSFAARLSSPSPDVEFLVDSVRVDFPFRFSLPRFTYRVRGAPSSDISVQLDLWDEADNHWQRTFTLPAWTPYRPVARLEILDYPPLGIGNGDGRLQAGETVELRLFLDTDQAPVENTRFDFGPVDSQPLTRVWIALTRPPTDPRYYQLTQPRGRNRGFEFTQSANDWHSINNPTYLVDSSVPDGSRLAFALWGRTEYAAWAETLYVELGPGGDQTPPVLHSPLHTWQGNQGLHLVFPADAAIDGGPIAAVAAEVAGGRSVPLRRTNSYYFGLWPDPPPGEHSITLAVTDQAGNTARWTPQTTPIDDLSAVGLVRPIAGGLEEIGTGLASHVRIPRPAALATDAQNRLYIADPAGDRVLRWDPSGFIETFAPHARLSRPEGLAMDPGDNLYIADTGHNRIRKVSHRGLVTTVAGPDSGQAGFAGDGGPATDALFNQPHGLALSPWGDIYIADAGNNRIRKISADGIITTIAGNGSFTWSDEDQPALGSSIHQPSTLALAPDGSLYFADRFYSRVQRLDPAGFVATVAGSNHFSRDLGRTPWPAIDALLFRPLGLLFDPAGDLLLSDSRFHSIRKIDRAGLITPVLRIPDSEIVSLAVDGAGNLFMGDDASGRVFMQIGAFASGATPTVLAEAETAVVFALQPNAPNPFNAATTIAYSVPQQTQVQLILFNLLGQPVRSLINREKKPGHYRAVWDGRDDQGQPVANGVYLYRLQAGDQVQTRKLMLLK